MDNNIHFDCKKYTGYKPCGVSADCGECDKYDPHGKHILIIKLGAMGDVLRTTPILPAIKEKYSPCHITWITDPNAVCLLKNNPYIDRLLGYDHSSLLILMVEKFDVVLNFEKEPRALALSKIIQSRVKLGFAPSDYGTLTVYNLESLYALQLGLSNDLKFYKNKKTYPQIIFEMAKLDYKGEEYILPVSKDSEEFGLAFRAKNNLDNFKHIVGIHTGCGKMFISKSWNEDGFVNLIKNLNKIENLCCLLLGGEFEKEMNERIKKRTGDGIVDAGCNNSIEKFIGIANQCDAVVSLDSLAMHIAIGLKKKTVVLFGATCPQEIDLFGRGEKIVSDFECCPCYKQKCEKSPNCMDAIKPEIVCDAVKRALEI